MSTADEFVALIKQHAILCDVIQLADTVIHAQLTMIPDEVVDQLAMEMTDEQSALLYGLINVVDIKLSCCIHKLEQARDMLSLCHKIISQRQMVMLSENTVADSNE